MFVRVKSSDLYRRARPGLFIKRMFFPPGLKVKFVRNARGFGFSLSAVFRITRPKIGTKCFKLASFEPSISGCETTCYSVAA